MDRCSHGCTKIGWTWGDVSQVRIMSELSMLLNLTDSLTKSCKNSCNIGSLLHGNNSQLIFFIDPDQESFIFVVKDSSSWRPISIQTSRFQKSITFFEQKVICNKLISLIVGHWFKWVVLTFKFSSKIVASTSYCLFNLFSLLSWNCRSKWEISKISSNSDSCWNNHLRVFFIKIWAFQKSIIHIALMFLIRFMFMILFYNLIKELSKNSIRVFWSRVNTNSRINVLTTWKNYLFEVESSFIRHIFILVEQFRIDILRDKWFCTFRPNWSSP